MFDIVLIRHGRTDWNQKGLYQGHTDRPLLENSRTDLEAYKIPSLWQDYTIVASPLLRAQQTAQILFNRVDFTESKIIEMDMGEWEGKPLEEIKALEDYSPPSYGWKGWDYGPPGGETYRQVRTRFESWLKNIESPTIAVTHKGVILAALGLAHNWDMASKRPFKMPADVAYLFKLESNGTLRFEGIQTLK